MTRTLRKRFALLLDTSGFLTDTALLIYANPPPGDLGITDLTGLEQCPNLTYLIRG
jgi:hypothetical protein